MTPTKSESQRVQIISDEQLASRGDVGKLDRDTKLITTVGFLATIIVITAVAVLGYARITTRLDNYEAERVASREETAKIQAKYESDRQEARREANLAQDKARAEISDLKAQLAGVSAQLLSLGTDLKIANAVSVARSSDRWSAQMMIEFSVQLKDTFKGVTGVDWTQFPNVRNIQSAVGQPGT